MNLARIVAAAILAVAAFAAAARGVDEASEAAMFGTLPAEASVVEEARAADFPLMLMLDLGLLEGWVYLAFAVLACLAVWYAFRGGPERPRSLLGHWLARRERRLDEARYKRGVIVSFDDAGLSVQVPRAEAEAISWAEVRRIVIERVDSSPAGAGLWWLLEGEGKRCAFPRGARGEREVRVVLAARFQGFSRGAVVEAKHAKTEARFVCWERSAAGQGEPAQTTARPRAGATGRLWARLWKMEA